MPETLNLISPSGAAVAVPIDQVPAALEQGFRVESGGDAAERVGYEARTSGLTGLYGAGVAALGGLARGATLGLSDVALDAGHSPLAGAAEAHPTISTAAQIAGAVAPAIAALPAGAAEVGADIGGIASIARATPAGMSARLGAKIAGLGEGGGAIVRGAAAVGSGAAEGAIQGAGNYVSAMALQDRPLSIDGFVADMGQGALWGGAAGGALKLAEGAVTNARRLFPRQEVTREAVAAAEHEASTAVSTAVREADDLEAAAAAHLEQVRAEAAAADPAVASKLEQVTAEHADDMRATLAPASAEPAIAAEVASPPPVRRAFAEADVPAAQIADDVAAAAPAPAAEIAAAADDPLMAALRGTRAKLAEGEQLGGMARRAEAASERAAPAAKAPRARALRDKLDDAIGEVDPTAAPVAKALRDVRMSKDEIRAWIAETGKGRSRPGVATDWNTVGRFQGGGMERVSRIAGTADEVAEWQMRAQARDMFRPTLAEDIIAGTKSIDDLRGVGFRPAIKGEGIAEIPGARVTADDVLSVSNQQLAERGLEPLGLHVENRLREMMGEPTIDAGIAKQLAGRADDLSAGELQRAAEVVGNFERAHAELADALGPLAPPGAAARAAEYRAAAAAAEAKAATGTAQAAADAQKAADLIALGAPPPAAGHAGKLGDGAVGAFKAAAKAGEIVEALHLIGVHAFDPASIPVIGPLLSLVLKARIMSRVWKRLGSGEIPATAESTIASKAAAARTRTIAAVDAMLTGAERGIRRGAAATTTTAAVLGASLYRPAGEARRAPPARSAVEAFRARAEEIAQARQPGAVAEALRARIRTSDPDLIAGIVGAVERKLAFLDSVIPKPPAPALGVAGRKWEPAPAELARFARYVRGAEDPVGVFERSARGEFISIEEAQAVRACYPPLFAAAQRRLLEQVSTAKDPIPFERRAALSTLFGVPLDPSETRDMGAWLQAGYKAPAAQPSAPASAPPAGAPTIQAPIDSSDRAMMAMDRRAGK